MTAEAEAPSGPFAESPMADRLILVVGAHRSGTNWAQRVVAAHPEAVGVPTETYLFSHGVVPMSERIQHATPGSFSLGLVYMDRQRYLRAMRHFCDEVFVGLIETLDPRAKYVVERTPHHTLCLDVIAALYPDARVVHIVRDGRDVARSQLSTGFGDKKWGPDTVREAAAAWDRYVRAAREQASGFARYVEVRYERLLAAPAEEIEVLYRDLDLPVDAETVSRAARESEVPFNVDPKMPGVAANKWREVFSESDLAVFDEVAGATLRDLGYADGS